MKGGKQTEIDEGREHGRRMERQGQAERTRRQRLKPHGLPFQTEETYMGVRREAAHVSRVCGRNP